MIQYITMALSICSLACSIALFASVLWCSPKRSLKRSLKRHQKETKSEDIDAGTVEAIYRRAIVRMARENNVDAEPYLGYVIKEEHDKLCGRGKWL